ncbi:MAG: hypothetical protein JZU49_00940 [Sulfuricurvum sp.]|nr:hypothetical protein [Sulfuricurvum sp.]
MNFADKKKAYKELQNSDHLCCDKELLGKLAPKSASLKSGIVDKEKAQRDVLWDLLDVATVDEIIAYRKPGKKLPIKDVTALSYLLKSKMPTTKLELKQFDEMICELMDSIEADGIALPDDIQDEVSEVKKQLSQAMLTIQFTDKLLALDLEKATQPQMAAIARGLKLEPADFKGATLRIVLDDYRLNLPKIGEATEEEMIPTPSTPSTNSGDVSGDVSVSDAPIIEEAEDETPVAELVEAKKKADTDQV